MVAVVVEMEKVHHIKESLHLEMDPAGAVVPVLIVDQSVLKEQVAVMVIRVEWDLKEEIIMELAAVVAAPVVVGMMLILLLGLIQCLTLMLVEEVMVHLILIDMEILLLIIHLLVIFTMLAVVQEDGVVQLLQIMRVEDEVVLYQPNHGTHLQVVLVNLVPLTPEVVVVEEEVDKGMVDQVEMVDLAYV